MRATVEETTSLLGQQLNAKCVETATHFDSKLQKLSATQTTELCHHTKHVADQHEVIIDDIKITMDDIRDEILQSSPKQAYIDAHSKSTSSLPHLNSKWKLSNVKSLNTKALDIHLDNLKLAVDLTQEMMLLHSNVALLTCVGTDGIVEIPPFEDIEESFSHKRCLAPQTSAAEHHACKCHYDYFTMLMASRLKNGLQDSSIMCNKAKEVRLLLDLHNESSDGLGIILTILQHLVPRLGHHALEHDPATLVLGLKASSRGSCKSFHSKAEEIEDILNCLRDDHGPHKLISRYL